MIRLAVILSNVDLFLYPFPVHRTESTAIRKQQHGALALVGLDIFYLAPSSASASLSDGTRHGGHHFSYCKGKLQ